MGMQFLGATITNSEQINRVPLPKGIDGVLLQHIWDGTDNPIPNLYVWRVWNVKDYGDVSEASLLYKVSKSGSGFIPFTVINSMDFNSHSVSINFLHRRTRYIQGEYPYIIQVYAVS